MIIERKFAPSPLKHALSALVLASAWACTAASGAADPSNAPDAGIDRRSAQAEPTSGEGSRAATSSADEPTLATTRESESLPEENTTSTSSESSTETATGDLDAGQEPVDASASPQMNDSSSPDGGDATTLEVNSEPAVTDSTSGVPTSSTEPVETESAPPLRNYLPCEVEQIIASRCRVCHGRAGLSEEPLLDDWTQVRSVGALVLEVVETDEMPMLPPPLTSEQKAILEVWVNAGAPAITQAEPLSCSP